MNMQSTLKSFRSNDTFMMDDAAAKTEMLSVLVAFDFVGNSEKIDGSGVFAIFPTINNLFNIFFNKFNFSMEIN